MKYITAAFWIALIFVFMADGRLWRPVLSYVHERPWTDCKKTQSGEWEHFVCREGELYLKELR